MCPVQQLMKQEPCRNQYLLPVCPPAVIVKASSGPRYVVGCRAKVDKAKLTSGTRVALDMTTLTIMRALPREVRHEQQYTAAAPAATHVKQRKCQFSSMYM